jgi:hypothetical protein
MKERKAALAAKRRAILKSSRSRPAAKRGPISEKARNARLARDTAKDAPKPLPKKGKGKVVCAPSRHRDPQPPPRLYGSATCRTLRLLVVARMLRKQLLICGWPQYCTNGRR